MNRYITAACDTTHMHEGADNAGTAALVVSNGQGQERAHHSTTINDVAVEEQGRICDLHLFAVRVDVVDQGIHRLGEVIRGAHVHVRSGGGFGSKVRSGGKVVVACL